MSFFFNPDEFTGKKTIRNSFLADPCKICGLYKNCESPKMKPFGDNRKNILALGEAPGKNEDEEGIGFIGKSGDYLKNVLYSLDINFEKDCARSNVIQCRPKDNVFPTDKVIYCYSRLEEQIKELKPKLILCFGMEAVKRILETNIIPSKMEGIHGTLFSSRKYKCYVSCNYHPAYVLRKKGGDKFFKGQPEIEDVFRNDIEKALEYLNTEFILENEIVDAEIEVLENSKAIEFLKHIRLDCKRLKPEDIQCTIDFETNRLSPFFNDSKIICLGIKFGSYMKYVISLENISEELVEEITIFLNSDISFTCHNGKFESIWAKEFFNTYIKNRTWDTMLAAHVLDERPDTKSLGFQTYLYTGIEYKEMVDRKNIENTDRKTVYKYNAADVNYTRLISKIQNKKATKEKLIKPIKFLVRGDAALARLEFNGVKIDKDEFNKYKESMETQYKEVVSEISIDSLSEDFRIKKGRSLDINKNEDLKTLFFDIVGVTPISQTEKGSSQVNEDLFNAYKDDPEIGNMCKLILQYKAINKMKTTYINAIEKYVDPNWILHPTYNLWTARTYRSSCDNPNLQNIPKRDETQIEFRKIFIPRYDILIDADHKGSEVVIQALLAKDDVLIKQLKEGFDPHKYWAGRLYELPEDKIDKKQRYNAKNGFVFPLIYGSYYKTIAVNLKLIENHVKKCEDEFFTMYDDIAKYQDDKVREYKRNGYVSTPLGFRRRGLLSRNQIVNTPIQATSFHYLLDTLSKLIMILEKYKFKSLPVLQIHDDIVLDCKDNEVDDIIEIIDDLTKNKPYWKWVNDISINIEYSKGLNWLEMEKINA